MCDGCSLRNCTWPVFARRATETINNIEPGFVSEHAGARFFTSVTENMRRIWFMQDGARCHCTGLGTKSNKNLWVGEALYPGHSWIRILTPLIFGYGVICGKVSSCHSMRFWRIHVNIRGCRSTITPENNAYAVKNLNKRLWFRAAQSGKWQSLPTSSMKTTLLDAQISVLYLSVAKLFFQFISSQTKVISLHKNTID